jgi:hypothetical protein
MHWSASIAIAGLLIGLSLSPGLAQAVTFQRGDRVREKILSPSGEPKRTGMVVTVVAQPGDDIEIRGSSVLVNGQPITRLSAEVIAMVAGSRQTPDRMPANQYLVMGESRDSLNNIVRKWGLYFGAALEPAGD